MTANATCTNTRSSLNVSACLGNVSRKLSIGSKGTVSSTHGCFNKNESTPSSAIIKNNRTHRSCCDKDLQASKPSMTKPVFSRNNRQKSAISQFSSKRPPCCARKRKTFIHCSETTGSIGKDGRYRSVNVSASCSKSWWGCSSSSK